MKDFQSIGGVRHDDSPQPPSCVDKEHGGITLDNMPLCARCVREGGITLFGRKHHSQTAAIHPNHASVQRNNRGHIVFTNHKGPTEPLCCHHAELIAWEHRGEALNYPAPIWTKAPRHNLGERDA